MTEQNKQLLLKDICARLPYETIVRNYATDEDDVLTYSLLEDFEIVGLEYIKPYLRSMSSMTEEEENELDKVDKESSRIFFNDLCSRVEKCGQNNSRGFLPDYPTLDWLNAHHFDYRGLIEKGLALEAPKDMYKTK